MTNDPGRRIVRTSEVDAHHFVCRFNWQLMRGDGTRGAESVDFVEFAADGKICRVTGFFGPLAPDEALGRGGPARVRARAPVNSSGAGRALFVRMAPVCSRVQGKGGGGRRLAACRYEA